MNGVKHYQSDAGIHVVRVHYSADPDKNPNTPRGAEWLRNSLIGYPGGMGSAAWRQEMEVDWDVAGGELVFPDFEAYRHRIVTQPFPIPATWRLYASFDYGHRNPSSFHVHAMDFDGNVWTIWEFYQRNLGYREQARAIRAYPRFKDLAFNPVADPSIFIKSQAGATQGEEKAVSQLFFELPDDEQIVFIPGNRGGDITFAEKVKGFLWPWMSVDHMKLTEEKKKEEARWRIFSSCPMLLWELERMRYADFSSIAQEARNVQEKIIDKDNHAWDDCKYFFMMFFFRPEKEKEDRWEKLRAADPLSWKIRKEEEEKYPSEGGTKDSSLGDFE